MEEKEIKKQHLKNKIMTKEEYEHMRHAIKEERAKKMAEIEVEIAYLESKRADFASVYAEVQQKLTHLRTEIKAKHAEKASLCETYLHRMQELEAQFVASKHEVEQ
jgi:ABC-type molybdate transport system substrate-binding protein